LFVHLHRLHTQPVWLKTRASSTPAEDTMDRCVLRRGPDGMALPQPPPGTKRQAWPQSHGRADNTRNKQQRVSSTPAEDTMDRFVLRRGPDGMALPQPPPGTKRQAWPQSHGRADNTRNKRNRLLKDRQRQKLDDALSELRDPDELERLANLAVRSHACREASAIIQSCRQRVVELREFRGDTPT
jgi:hypothetical protein